MSDPELDSLLSAGDIAELRRDAGNALGLPGLVYGPEFFALERRRLFPRTWCAIAYESDMPGAGDALPVELAGWPLLVVRGEDDEVRVFHNVCRHRQMQVVPEACRARRTLNCPWHGWAYDLRGRLLATPRIGGRREHRDPRFDERGLDLKPVRSGIWLDMVFVNLDGRAPTLDEHLRPLRDLLHEYDFSGLEVGDRLAMNYPGNWKLTMEGAIEDYHLPVVHPELVQGEVESHPRLDHVPRCFFANSSRREYEDPRTSGEAAALGSGLPGITRSRTGPPRTFAIGVFPSAFITTRPNHLSVFLCLPEGYRHTRLDFRFYYKGKAARGFAGARRRIVEFWQRVFEQDLPLVERVQRNSERPESGDIRPRFSPFWESNVHRFQCSVVDLLLAPEGGKGDRYGYGADVPHRRAAGAKDHRAGLRRRGPAGIVHKKAAP